MKHPAKIKGLERNSDFVELMSNYENFRVFLGHFSKKIARDAEEDFEGGRTNLSRMLYGFSEECQKLGSTLGAYMSFNEAKRERLEYDNRDWEAIANNAGDLHYNVLANLFAHITARAAQRVPFEEVLDIPNRDVGRATADAYRAIDEISKECDRQISN